ncbi:NVEALA domain-containing protein [Phocaeicola sp.]
MIFVFAIIVVAVVLGKTSHEEVAGELFLDNVEALAAGEFDSETCIGSGNVTCCTGEKVEYVITHFNLE